MSTFKPILPLIAAAIACHGGRSSPPPAVPRPSSDVLVRVFEGRDVSPESCRPVAGVVVVAHGVDGAALQTARTDELGQARLSDFPVGGAVTIVEPHAPSALRTVFGAIPGDVIDVPVEASPSPARGRLSGRWKPYPGAAGYQMFDGCNETRLATAEAPGLDLHDRCLSPWRSASAIVYAKDAAGTYLAYATLTGATVGTERGTSVSLGPWKTDFANVSLRLPRAAETTVWARRYDGTASAVLGAPAIPSGFFDELIVEQVDGHRSVLRSLPWPAKAGVLEIAEAPPLDIDPPVVEGVGARLRLRTHAVGANADMLIGLVRWADVRWSFVASPAATTVAFPVLPAELGVLVPSGGPRVASVTVVDHSHFDSWDQARRELRWSSAFGAPQDVVDLGGFVAMATAVVEIEAGQISPIPGR